MSQLDRFLQSLDLESIGPDRYRGAHPPAVLRRVFGGQVLAQALVAATRSVEDRPTHSLHAYFLRPGDPERPIEYQVHRLRDGRSFTTRSVDATQGGETILHMSVSFHDVEEGLGFAPPPPAGPMEPEGVPYEEDMKIRLEHMDATAWREDLFFDPPLEIRTVGGLWEQGGDDPAGYRSWLRAKGPMPDDPALHQALLAFASDVTIGRTVLKAHRAVPGQKFQGATLDHALWFHRPFDLTQPILYLQECVQANAARGFTRGTFHTQDGTLVASCTQEALIRIGEVPASERR